MIRYDPHSQIEVGGARFDSWRDDAYFKEVSVSLSTDSASEAVWKIHDPGYKLLDRWVSADGLTPLEVKVWLALGPDLGAAVFEGLLAGATWEDETTSFTFYDRGYLMRRRQEREYHRGLTDVQIIAKLAKQNGLAFEGPDKPVKLDKHKSAIQDAQTDWEFASERARDVGLVLYVRGNTLYAKEATRVNKTAPPALTISLADDGRRLTDRTSFRYRAPENQKGRPGAVTVHSRADGKGGRALVGKSEVNRRGTHKAEIKHDLAIKTKRHADRRAHASKELAREHSYELNITLLSDFGGRRPDVRQTIKLDGAGKLFGGLYVVNEVHHQFGPGVMETELQCYRDVVAD
jgi:phage protein D